MIHINISRQLQFFNGNKPLSVNIILPKNNIIAIYGESGAGKTTLLKIIAGLVKPDEGFIKMDNTIWLDVKHHINIPPQQRSIGFVFQDYALFPNMTVLQNLQYAANKKEDDSFILHLAEMVSLQSFLHAKPSQLSGGQQQRVALIRALVRKPKLVLLDEPLSALDTDLRYQLGAALQQLQKELSFTAILVSHNKEEVCALAQHVIQLQEGEVVFEGAPKQLFTASRFTGKLQLTAKVISIKPNADVCFIELSTGANTISLTLQLTELKNVSIGDTITIHSEDGIIDTKKSF